MLKSGIIIGTVALLFGLGIATTISPLCVPCWALLLGIAAGILAGAFEKPAAGNQTLKTGALAGLISGIGLVLGQVIGAVINAVLMGPEGVTRLLQSFGMYSSVDASMYYLVIVGSTLCIGILDLILMAGFGLLGALAWGSF